MKLRITSNYLVSFLTILLFYPVVHSQTNAKTNLYDWFDNAIGKENLNINNGPLHSNPYRTITNKNRYYIDEFSVGNISYENQIYFDVKLKYDILEDQVIFKLNKQTDNLAINLIQDKVNFFFIRNKKFINLNSKIDNLPDFITGYYEENFIGNSLELYIKHSKKRKEIYYFDGFYSDYIENNEFVLKHKNTFQKIDSEKEIKQLFPEYKKAISNFYYINRAIEKSDKKQFMENLIKHIDSFSNKNLK